MGPKGKASTNRRPSRKLSASSPTPACSTAKTSTCRASRKFSTETKGLEPGVTYEYRAVVTNEAGSVATPDPGIHHLHARLGQSTPAPTRKCGGRRKARCCPTAAPTSWSRPPTRAATTSSPSSPPGRTSSTPTRTPRTGCSTRCTSASSPGSPGARPTSGSTPISRFAANEGWTTKYVGLPANGMADEGALRLAAARAPTRTSRPSPSAAPNICDPCFADGSTNVPLRRANGALEKGMQGSLNPPADPVGEVRKPVSADGSHLIFAHRREIRERREQRQRHGSTTAISATEATQVVSTLPAARRSTGEVAELDVSSEGRLGS